MDTIETEIKNISPLSTEVMKEFMTVWQEWKMPKDQLLRRCK
jgi:hypothetical protein